MTHIIKGLPFPRHPKEMKIYIPLQKDVNGKKDRASLHFLFPLMIAEGLSGPGGEVLRAGQTVGANLSAPLHSASPKLMKLGNGKCPFPGETQV